MSVLVLVDHDRGRLSELTPQALSFGRELADALGTSLEAVVIGAGGDAAVPGGAVDSTWRVNHELLTDYAPEAWGEVLMQLMEVTSPAALLAPGSERGNEVLAHVAAAADLPMAANVTASEVGSGPWKIERVRWGGSLLEEAELSAPVPLLSAAPHAFPAASLEGVSPTSEFAPVLEERHVASRVMERATRAEGVTLATAPVVVSGGRGVGGPEGFAPLEELAALLGGAVGCSRVATNNGWRPHSDQVGQTGTRVAPEVYIACGISGAIQHWVGMMSAKHVIAINTDPEAPMVTRAEYAVVGDVASVVPAIVAEIRSRRP